MKTTMTERETTATAVAAVTAIVLAIIVLPIAIFFYSKPAHGEKLETFAGSFIISGYGRGEFAIKGEPEKTLNEGIADVKALPKFAGDSQMHFICVGSADVIGSSVGNDELAAKRAKQVEAVLSANFSDAKIVAWSKGDADNIRQVRVEYKIIPVPTVATPQAPAVVEKVVEKVIESKSSRIEFYLLLGICVMGFILIFWIIGRRKGQNKKVESETQWLEVNGCKVKVKVKGRFYYSPFTSRSGQQICRDNKKGIIDSLKGCLKGMEFEEQKQVLIKKEVIVAQ